LGDSSISETAGGYLYNYTGGDQTVSFGFSTCACDVSASTWDCPKTSFSSATNYATGCQERVGTTYKAYWKGAPVSGGVKVSAVTTFDKTIAIKGGTPGDKKILASDATGNASWKTAAELGLGGGASVSGTAGVVPVFNVDGNGLADSYINQTASGEYIYSKGSTVPIAFSGSCPCDKDSNVADCPVSFVSPTIIGTSASSYSCTDRIASASWTVYGPSSAGGSLNFFDKTTADKFAALGVVPNTTIRGLTNVIGGFKYVDNNQGANKILVSDVNGLAHWKNISDLAVCTDTTSAVTPTSQTFTTPGSNTFVVPQGVTELTATLWGAGGGGGTDNTGSAVDGSGGGGGGFIGNIKFKVKTGDAFNITVGAGGAGGGRASNGGLPGAAGGDSIITGSANGTSISIMANGGKGGGSWDGGIGEDRGGAGGGWGYNPSSINLNTAIVTESGQKGEGAGANYGGKGGDAGGKSYGGGAGGAGYSGCNGCSGGQRPGSAPGGAGAGGTWDGIGLGAAGAPGKVVISYAAGGTTSTKCCIPGINCESSSNDVPNPAWKTLSGNVSYTKTGGIVFIRINGANSTGNYGTLPAGYRPGVAIRQNVPTNTVYYDYVTVGTDGAVNVTVAASGNMYQVFSYPAGQ
ncbi:MAG TPA: hypothetical protein P5056_03100, partial [Candidatus Paceibacterota bacterium]|nr:hypothetical protein [Candidatus Paceibacterota bacterium]